MTSINSLDNHFFPFFKASWVGPRPKPDRVHFWGCLCQPGKTGGSPFRWQPTGLGGLSGHFEAVGLHSALPQSWAKCHSEIGIWGLSSTQEFEVSQLDGCKYRQYQLRCIQRPFRQHWTTQRPPNSQFGLQRFRQISQFGVASPPHTTWDRRKFHWKNPGSGPHRTFKFASKYLFS